jgi:transcription elongation factor Elf1
VILATRPAENTINPKEAYMPLSYDHTFLCPHCAQPNHLFIDITEGDNQELIQDCEVCCQPLRIVVHLNDTGILSCDAEPLN